jgi:endonuclease YncB( thermonuclease family)
MIRRTILGLAAVLAVAGCEDDMIRGKPVIMEGDAFAIGETRIRLVGIDAPEMPQPCRNAAGAQFPCGRQAPKVLEEIVAGREAACEEIDRDRFGRVHAICRIDGMDIAAEMLRRGWAVAYPDHSPEYEAIQAEAKRERRGLWAGTFDAPWEWRAKYR